jgi:hypothetical protein
MAAKLKMLRLLQEMRGFAQITNRRPQARPPGLYLLQLRSHLVGTTSPQGKRTIVIEAQEQPEVPQPVKITHLKRTPLPTPPPTRILRIARF